jgi:hypothetical protein
VQQIALKYLLHRTPARALGQRVRNSVATWPEWNRNASKLAVSRPPLMASSIAGRIILDRVAAIEENTEDGRAAKNTANAGGQAGACQRNQT